MKLKTKTGRAVIIFDFDCGGEKPLVGVYEAGINEWIAGQWNHLGHYNVNNGKYVPSSLDLANVPNFQKLEFEDDCA